MSLLVKVAVTVWLPAVRLLTVAVAIPLEMALTGRAAPSTPKVTVPLGVPKVEAIVADNVTVSPNDGAAGEIAPKVRLTRKGALFPTWTISSVGGVVSRAFAALPANVAVLVKFCLAVGAKLDVNWHVPPGTTVIALTEPVQLADVVRLSAKFVWSGSVSDRLAATLPVDSSDTVVGDVPVPL